MPRLLDEYRNGTYFVRLYDDGTKVRIAPNDVFDPNRPETIDCTIQTACDNGCSFCYLGCTRDGEYADFSKYKFLDNMPVMLEVAINLQFPLHSGLEKFLENLHEQHVIVNATVQQKHFCDNYPYIIDLIGRGLISGLGVSYSFYDPLCIELIKNTPNTIIHVIAGLLSNLDVEHLQNQGLKILILGYKELGRGVECKEKNRVMIKENMDWLQRTLPELGDKFKLISFDNLAIEQLHVKDWIPDETWEESYMGDEATTSFYVDLVHGYYAPNSLSSDHRTIGDMSLIEMFNDIKGSLS